MYYWITIISFLVTTIFLNTKFILYTESLEDDLSNFSSSEENTDSKDITDFNVSKHQKRSMVSVNKCKCSCLQNSAIQLSIMDCLFMGKMKNESRKNNNKKQNIPKIILSKHIEPKKGDKNKVIFFKLGKYNKFVVPDEIGNNIQTDFRACLKKVNESYYKPDINISLEERNKNIFYFTKLSGIISNVFDDEVLKKC